MKVELNLNGKNLKLNSKSKGVYLPLGDAYFITSNYSSRYFGLIWKEFKIFDFNNVFPLKHIKVKENELFIDGYTFVFKGNKMIVDNFIPILVDLRHLYDTNPFNRKYRFYKSKNFFVLESDIGKITFKGHFKEKTEKDIKKLVNDKIINNYSFDGKYFWIEKTYSFDLRRKDLSNWYVLYLFDFKGEIEFWFEFKDKKEEIKSIKLPNLNNNFLKMAYLLAARNLLDKQVGRPWFFQDWKRDKLLSLNAYYILNEDKFVKEIIFNYFKEAYYSNKQGNLFRNFHTDEFGLLLKRIVDFWHLFNDNEKGLIKEKLFSFDFLAPIYNKKQDTWMDSISREGISIEIQALFYEFYKFMEEEDKEFLILRKKLEKIGKEFIKNDLIIDNLEEQKIRPNFILAAYFSEEFAEKVGIYKFFKNTLRQLMLNWGGVASLSFCDVEHYKEHTGIDSKSYHNGDSWYYINNLTALIILRDFEKFKDIVYYCEDFDLMKFAYKLLNASLEDLYNQFIFGAHSEISSAIKQESLGCFDQMWSNATLIEVLKFLADSKNRI